MFAAALMLFRGQHHRHVPPFQLRLHLELPDVIEFLARAKQDFPTQLRMRNLPASKHHRQLHLVSVLQELARMPGLELEIVIADPRPVLHFLQVKHVLLLLRRARRFGLFETVLAVVHYLHYRRTSHGCHFDEVKPSLYGGPLRFVDRHDANLLSVRTDQPDWTYADLFVYPNSILFLIANGQ